MPWNPKDTMSLREEFVRLASQSDANRRELCRRFGISPQAAYKWLARYASNGVLCQGARVKYRFINKHRHEFRIAAMCRVLRVARAGFYAWLHKPMSDRDIEDPRLLGLIRDSYTASGGVYGSLRVFADLREVGETCGKHRVAKIMRTNKIHAMRGYKPPRRIAGRPSIIMPNGLNRQFTADVPDRAWVTDITYLRTWQGWWYLAVVIDLHSRKVVGWSMKPTLARELVLDALLMALWRKTDSIGHCALRSGVAIRKR